MLNSKSTSKEKIKSRLSRIARELVSAKKIMLCFLAFTCSINFTNAQWQKTNGPAGAGKINCIAVSGANIFTGTSSSGVFLSTDSGTTWTAVNNGLAANDVLSLAISGANLFAGTNGGGVFLSTDNGSSWTAVNSGLTNFIIAQLAVSGTNILAGTFGNGVFLSADMGTSWTAVNNGISGSNFSLLAIVNGTNIFAGTVGGYLNLSTNNGSNWTEIDNSSLQGPINSIAINGVNIFLGTGGGVYLSTNAGSTWTPVNNGLSNTNVNALASIGTSVIAGTNGGVFLSTDSGTTWTAVNNGLTDTTVFSFALGGVNVFAGTDTSGVWKRQISGISCSPFIYASSATAISCGDSVTLSASVGTGYLWSNGETTQNIVVTSAGNYSCNVSNNCGNLSSNVISVTLSVTISAIWIHTAIICGNGVTLTASAGNSYLWSDFESTQSITVTDAGNYSCTITTNCGTVTSNVISVTAVANTISPSSQINLCPGDSVTLTAISANGYWSDGETTQSIVVKKSGYYYNTIDCHQQELTSNIVQVYIFQSPDATIAPPAATLCQGAMLTVSNDTTYYNSNIVSILWSNGATTSTIAISTPQTYSVAIKDANGCPATASTTITTISPPPAIPVITANGATTFCDGDSVELTSSAASGYFWNNGATTQSIMVKSSDGYAVTISNANGCSTTSSLIDVTVHSNPIPPTIQQFNDSLKSSYATGNQWYLNGNIISGATGQYYVVTQSGIYTVKLTNGNGCSSSASLNFTLVGVAELTSDYSFTIYPNPATNELTFNTTSRPCCATAAVSIMNILGETLLSRSLSLGEGRGEAIDISKLSAGMYFLQMKTESAIDTKRFIKE